MASDRFHSLFGKSAIRKLIIPVGLSVIFWFAWILFAMGFYIVFRGTVDLPPELRAIVLAILGLFGAVNVMMLSMFLLIVNLLVRLTSGKSE